MSSPIFPEPVRPSPNSLRWVALLGIVMFAIAPWLVALDVTREDGVLDQYPGWPLLFFGWIGVFDVLYGKSDAVGWLANPFFIIGSLVLFFDRFGQQRIATNALFTAAVISLSSFLMKEVVTGLPSFGVFQRGSTAAVTGYNIGFWLWIAAIWFNFLVARVVESQPVSRTVETNQ